MPDILKEIVEYKKEVVATSKAKIPLSSLVEQVESQPHAKGFLRALRHKIEEDEEPALIAELKKASPSKGIIREDFDPVTLAAAYQEGGATCLSILTDERYFSGSNEYLQEVVSLFPLPVLRKDFMIDPYQVTESRALGADCILLIMAALEDELAVELEHAAQEMGMDVLVEVHNEEELERALSVLKSHLIGVNNRNLKTLEVDLHTSIRLSSMIPKDKLLVCESGIHSYNDIETMREYRFHSFLVGESLMRKADVELATKELLGKKR